MSYEILDTNYKINLGGFNNRWIAWIYALNVLEIKNPKMVKIGGYK